MAKALFALFVNDAAKRNAYLKGQHEARIRRENPRKTDAKIREILEEHGAMKGGPLEQVEAHDLHCVCESACPDGLLNCRNCGDPAFRESCRAAGHCAYCGTRHGIAPDSHLVKVGLALTPLDTAPTADDEWDRASQKFKKRPPAPPHP